MHDHQSHKIDFSRVNTTAETVALYVVLLSLLRSKLIFNSTASLINAPGE